MAAHHGYSIDAGYKGMFASVGVDVADVLRRAGLPDDLLNRPDARVSTDQYFAFAQAIEDTVDDPLFVLRLVEQVSAEWFSPPVFAALCSPDLETALARLARFKPLIAPVRLDIETDAAHLRVAYHWHESPIGAPPLLAGSEALFIVKLARMGTRASVRAADVTLHTLPANTRAFEAFLGCEIRRADVLSVSFDLDDARRPFVTNHSAMWEIFEPELRRRLAELEGTASFAARTRAVLLEALPAGNATVPFAARRLAVSQRTLQRRLHAEGTSFQSIVRATRERLARHYLGQTQYGYSEIAHLLGFDEPSSFFRAFQDWTGSTPDAMRRALRGAT